MALPIAVGTLAGLDSGLGVGLVTSNNLKSKVKHRDRDITNLKLENQALRDQLEQAQSQQTGATPWSNLLQFSQSSLPYQQQQQPTAQLLNMASQLMQQMSQGMGSMPSYSGMVGPQTGNLSNCNPNVQNLFQQMQDMQMLSGGLYTALGAYQNLQRQSGPNMPLNCAPPWAGAGSPQQPVGFGLPQQPGGFGSPQMPAYGQPAVPNYGQPNNDRATITTLGKYATKLFSQGHDNLSMSDIQGIAQGGRCPDGTEPPADLKMACQAMMASPALFDKLHSTVKASKGKRDTDGLASAKDVQMLMQQMKEATPNAPVTYNTNTPTQPYSPYSAYGTSFANALMGHLQSTGINPYMLNLLQQPAMLQQQPAMRQPVMAN